MSTFTNPEYDKKYLTISKISGINKAMKKLQTKITNQKTIDVLSYIALSFAIIFALGFLLFFIYGIASAIVFTTLVPLVIFGASVVCLGLSAALFGYFFNHNHNVAERGHGLPGDDIRRHGHRRHHRRRILHIQAQEDARWPVSTASIRRYSPSPKL